MRMALWQPIRTDDEKWQPIRRVPCVVVAIGGSRVTCGEMCGMLWNFFPSRSERDTGPSIFHSRRARGPVAARLPGSNEGPSHPAYTCY